MLAYFPLFTGLTSKNDHASGLVHGILSLEAYSAVVDVCMNKVKIITEANVSFEYKFVVTLNHHNTL